MSTTVLLLIGVPMAGLAVLMLLTAGLMGAARRRGTQVRPLSQGMPMGIPADVRDRALELLRQNKQIHAIKAVREATGLGLKEAKDYCDALRDGRTPPYPVLPARSDGMLADRVRALLHGGQRDSALELVRAETGMSRSEAMRFVDALD